MPQRRRHRADFRAKVAVAAIRGDRTLSEIASTFGVHPVQITHWKRQALAAPSETTGKRRDTEAEGHEALKAGLYQKIGQLKLEPDWLKKEHLRPGPPREDPRETEERLGVPHRPAAGPPRSGSEPARRIAT